MVYVKKNFPVKIIRIEKDNFKGNFIIMKIEIYNRIMTLAGTVTSTNVEIP